MVLTTYGTYDYLLDDDVKVYHHDDLVIIITSKEILNKIYDVELGRTDRYHWHHLLYNLKDDAIAVKEAFYYNDSVYGNTPSITWTVYATDLTLAIELIEKYELKLQVNQIC